MTSTPIDHPRDDEQSTLTEDQGAARSDQHDVDDLVDAETKELSLHEAARHEDAAEAQETDARESGGYGH